MGLLKKGWSYQRMDNPWFIITLTYSVDVIGLRS